MPLESSSSANSSVLKVQDFIIFLCIIDGQVSYFTLQVPVQGRGSKDKLLAYFVIQITRQFLRAHQVPGFLYIKRRVCKCYPTLINFIGTVLGRVLFADLTVPIILMSGPRYANPFSLELLRRKVEKEIGGNK
jgi:hypothetical protein